MNASSFLALWLAATATAQATQPGKMTIQLRGKAQETFYYPSAITPSAPTPVLFSSGDGGWRGAAVTVAQTIASWGYDVYGFDSKRYLESFMVDGQATLTQSLVASDMAAAARAIGGGRKVILVGWSQGAGMSLAAAAAAEHKSAFAGVITLGLPRTAVLGWRFSDTLAVLARREPNEPSFDTLTLASAVTPLPAYVIYGDRDEYTSIALARELFANIREPRRLAVIPGGNHRFDGATEQFHQSLREGLSWIGRNLRENYCAGRGPSHKLVSPEGE